MAKAFQSSFYRWALGLADCAPVRLMHQLAREVYRDIGGEAIEEHLAIYAEIVDAWRLGGPDRPPMREALRAMGARDRGHARLEKLREQAWLQGRAEVFQRTGERIELPPAAEQGPGQGSGSFSGGSMPEKVPDPLVAGSADVSGSGTISRIPPREMEPDPAAQKMSQTSAREAEPEERLSGKQIKLALRRLIDAQADRQAVQNLREEARAGKLTSRQFRDRVHALLHAA